MTATHGIFSPPAYERIEASPITEVVVTNTLPVPEERRHGKIRVLSVAPLFAHADPERVQRRVRLRAVRPRLPAVATRIAAAAGRSTHEEEGRATMTETIELTA